MTNYEKIQHALKNFKHRDSELVKLQPQDEEDVTIHIEKSATDDHEDLVPALIIHLYDSEAEFTAVRQFINYDGSKQTSKELILVDSAE